MSKKLIALDQASRLLSEALTAVLTAIKSGHSVRGISIFRIEHQYFVDMNLFDESSQKEWSLCLQLAAVTPEEATGTSKNPCAKTVTPEQAYEIWQVASHPEYGGTWTWYVLKKYKSPAKESQDPYARWYCYVITPYVHTGEYGDVYVKDITSIARKLDYNPLTHQDNRTTETEHTA